MCEQVFESLGYLASHHHLLRPRTRTRRCARSLIAYLSITDAQIADALVPRPSLRREQDSSASGASFSSMTTDASSATAFSIADMVCCQLCCWIRAHSEQIVPTSPKQASSPALSADHSSVRASPPIATPPSLPPPPAITFPAPPSLKKVKATANRTKLIILPEDYDRSGSGKTSCHVCRTRSNRYKSMSLAPFADFVISTMRTVTCTTEGCIKRFCGPCMRTRCVAIAALRTIVGASTPHRHAHIDGFRPADFEFTPNASFLCPFCRGNCQCSVCSERRIRSAAGIPTISIRKKIARSDRADSFELGRDSDSRPPPKKRPKPRAVKSMSIDAEGGDSGMSSSGERGGLPMPWAMPPVPLPVARPVYALDKIHLKLHLGPVAKAKEEEEEGCVCLLGSRKRARDLRSYSYASTASSGSDDSAPVNPLAAQRRLVRKLGVSTAPRRLSSCPQDLAPHHVPPPGVPTGLEYEPFDGAFSRSFRQDRL